MYIICCAYASESTTEALGKRGRRVLSDDLPGHAPVSDYNAEIIQGS